MLVSLLIVCLIYWLTKWRFLKTIIGVLLVLWLACVAFGVGIFITVGPTLFDMLSELIKML